MRLTVLPVAQRLTACPRGSGTRLQLELRRFESGRGLQAGMSRTPGYRTSVPRSSGRLGSCRQAPAGAAPRTPGFRPSVGAAQPAFRTPTPTRSRPRYGFPERAWGPSDPPRPDRVPLFSPAQIRDGERTHNLGQPRVTADRIAPPAWSGPWMRLTRARGSGRRRCRCQYRCQYRCRCTRGPAGVSPAGAVG